MAVVLNSNASELSITILSRPEHRPSEGDQRVRFTASTGRQQCEPMQLFSSRPSKSRKDKPS
jgi:hypothetical protein